MLEKFKEVIENLAFEPSEKQSEQNTATNNSNTSNDVGQPNSVKTSVPASKLDAEQQNVYNNLLERLNNQVFTRTTVYVQFANALKSLAPVIADMPTRYKAAFAMLGASGMTKDALLNALNVHVSDLATEASKFNEDTKKQLNTAVDFPNQKIEALSTDQEKDRQLINDIQKRIQTRTEEIQKTQQELTLAKNKISNVAAMFTAAESTVKQNLEHEAQNIKTYL